jgi:hypothetical protein
LQTPDVKREGIGKRFGKEKGLNLIKWLIIIQLNKEKGATDLDSAKSVKTKDYFIKMIFLVAI